MGNAHPEIPRCHADRPVCVLTASLPLACSPFPTATALVAEGLLHLLGTKRDGNLHEEALKQPLSNSVFSWIMAAVALSLRKPLPLCQGGNGNGHLLSQLSLDKVLQTSGTWLVQPSIRGLQVALSCVLPSLTLDGELWQGCLLLRSMKIHDGAGNCLTS